MDSVTSSLAMVKGLLPSNGIPQVQNYLYGVWSQPSGDGPSKVVNPSSGTEIAVVPYSNESDPDNAVVVALRLVDLSQASLG